MKISLNSAQQAVPNVNVGTAESSSLVNKYFIFEKKFKNSSRNTHLWSHYELREEDKDQVFHVAQDCS